MDEERKTRIRIDENDFYINMACRYLHNDNLKHNLYVNYVNVAVIEPDFSCDISLVNECLGILNRLNGVPLP